MQVKLKLFDKSLPVPKYQTEKAAGVDLYSRVDAEVPPHQVSIIPLNVALQVPDDHFVLMTARSSLHKRGLMMANGVGIGDADYCGNDDEYHAALYNFSSQTVQIRKGDRLVQIIILPRPKVEFELVKKLAAPNRGGFGSTGR